MTELDSKTSLELLDLMSEIVCAIDPEQGEIYNEPTDLRVRRIIQFLVVMKFNIPEEQMEDFQNLLLDGDKEMLQTIMHWCLQRFEHLQKRAYLAKYLMPVEIPAEFLNEDLIAELSQRLKELQTDFKAVHKEASQHENSGAKPSELRSEIAQLEQERTQLQNKIQKMKKDMNVDESYFSDMLKATSALRREQENEVQTLERMREHRKNAQEADLRFADASKRLNEMKSTGIRNQSAEQILSKLQVDVKELNDRRENVERITMERESHLDKLQSWDNADRPTTEDDVRMKEDQVRDLEDEISTLQERLDAALERNTKLLMFRQASTMALKKYREREDEVEKLEEELRRLQRQIDEKDAELKAQGRGAGGSGKIVKRDLKKYGAIVREKIEKYKKMREDLAALRSELVVLQRTEQILKSRHRNLDEFLVELERQKGVEGYRDTQRQMIEMTEKAAEVDQLKGSTLEEISQMVEQISREFKNKQAQLQPLIQELKNVRQEYMDVESNYQERRINYDKVAVGLDMEKQTLEKDCNFFQDECLREESRYHYLQHLIKITKIKVDRAEQEKAWQAGQGRMIRDFATLKEFYANKLTQQEHLTKQLRKKQKELKENSGALTNQKTNFLHLQQLLDMKSRFYRLEGGSAPGSRIQSAGGGGGGNFESFVPAHAEYSGGRADAKHDDGNSNFMSFDNGGSEY